MIKLISAKEAKEASNKAKEKIKVMQHKFAYDCIKKAIDDGCDSMSIPYKSVDLIFESLRKELEGLGYVVNLGQPVNPYWNPLPPNQKEVTVLW